MSEDEWNERDNSRREIMKTNPVLNALIDAPSIATRPDPQSGCAKTTASGPQIAPLLGIASCSSNQRDWSLLPCDFHLGLELAATRRDDPLTLIDTIAKRRYRDYAS